MTSTREWRQHVETALGNNLAVEGRKDRCLGGRCVKKRFWLCCKTEEC